MMQDFTTPFLGITLILLVGWGILGLIKPRAVLFFAHPAHKSRIVALLFPILLWGCLFLFVITLEFAVTRGSFATISTGSLICLVFWAWLAMLYRSLKNAPQLKAEGQAQAPSTTTPGWGERLSA